MPTSKSTPGEQLNAFEEEIQSALNYFSDAAWLGNESALAQPYVIGRLASLDSVDSDPESRGQVLKNLLLVAASQLPDRLSSGSTSPRQLLDISYFQRNPNHTLRYLADALNIAEKTYYRHRAETIRLLAALIHRRLQPSFQTEISSPAQNQVLIGRDVLLNTMLSELQPAGPVALIGPSGIGKTTLAQEVARRYAAQDANVLTARPVFWHTLRPSLTEHLSSLVFALAHFLRQHGADTSWKQLIADHGAIRREVLYGLLRFDLTHLASGLPLLCIDEIGTLSEESQAHQEILDLLEDMGRLVPTLLIGHRLPMPTEHQHTLAGLSESESAQLLTHLGINLIATQISQLAQASQGNAAFIKLFASLHRANGSTDAGETLQLIGRAPSTEFLFLRIWSRLRDDERNLLMQLAAFQDAVPSDPWQDQKHILDRLIHLELVRHAGMGLIEVTPHIAGMAHDRIPTDLHAAYQLRAAEVYEGRGNYTKALRHYVLGGQPAYGLWLWYAHRVAETEQGQGALARQVLLQIKPTQLADSRDRVTLGIALGQLHHLMGKPELAEEALRSVERDAQGISRAIVRQLRGYAQEAIGRTEAALESFRQSIDLWTSLPQAQTALLHGERSRLFQQYLGDIRQAEREALLARLTAEVFHGNVEQQLGHYDAARQMYESAISIADRLKDVSLQKAFAYFSAGNLAWKQNRIDDAIHLLETAIQICEQVGDTYRPIYGRRNLSATYIISGQYREAIRQAELGLERATLMDHSELIAGLAINAGEAHFYLGELEQAETYAFQSLAQEEQTQLPLGFTLLGMVRRMQNRHTESIQSLTDAVKSAQDIEDKYAEAAALRQLGETYLADHQLEPAREALNQALAHYEHMKLDKEIGEVRQLLSTL